MYSIQLYDITLYLHVRGKCSISSYTLSLRCVSLTGTRCTRYNSMISRFTYMYEVSVQSAPTLSLRCISLTGTMYSIQLYDITLYLHVQGKCSISSYTLSLRCISLTGTRCTRYNSMISRFTYMYEVSVQSAPIHCH